MLRCVPVAWTMVVVAEVQAMAGPRVRQSVLLLVYGTQNREANLCPLDLVGRLAEDEVASEVDEGEADGVARVVRWCCCSTKGSAWE